MTCCRLLDEDICSEANIPSISSINRIIRDKGFKFHHNNNDVTDPCNGHPLLTSSPQLSELSHDDVQSLSEAGVTTSPLQVGSPCAGGVLNNSESEPIVVTPQSDDNLTENSTLVPDHNHTNAVTPHHVTNGHGDVIKSVSVDDSQSVNDDEQVEIAWASFSDSQCDVR